MTAIKLQNMKGIMLCTFPAIEQTIITVIYSLLRNEFNFWNVHGIMSTLGLVQSKRSLKGFTLTLQENRNIHDCRTIPKIEFITYTYISYYQSSINFQFSPNLAGFPDILN